jgi:hypothetical protein
MHILADDIQMVGFADNPAQVKKLASGYLALEARCASMREVLTFYGNRRNWLSPSTGFALQYDPEPSPLETDGGKRARAVLKITDNGGRTDE